MPQRPWDTKFSDFFFFSFFEGGGTVNLESTICCKNLVLILTELWVQLHTPCGFFSYFYKWEIRGVNTAGKEGLQGKFVNPTARKFEKTEGKIKTQTRLRNFKSQITPLPLFYPLWWNWLVYSHSSKAWISNPKSMEKKELLWSIWTFPAWLQGCSQFANTTAFLGNKYLTAVGSASDKFHFGKQIPL